MHTSVGEQSMAYVWFYYFSHFLFFYCDKSHGLGFCVSDPVVENKSNGCQNGLYFLYPDVI